MTSSATRTFILAFILIAAGLGIFVFKATVLDRPLSAETRVNVWDFEIFVEFVGRDRPARVEVFLPPQSPVQTTFEEQFYSGAFGLTIATDTPPNRRAVWTYRFPREKKVLRYRAKVAAAPFDPDGEDLDQFNIAPQSPIADTVKRQAFIVWQSDLRRRSSDDETFAALALKTIFQPVSSEESDEISALLSTLPDPLNRFELAKRALGAEKIPARIANGIALADNRRRAPIIHWLEYEVDGEVKRFFPGEVPARVFTLWYGTEPFERTVGVSEFDVQISVQESREVSQMPDEAGGSSLGPILGSLDFDELPVTTQLVYQVLVTVPIGIMLLVFLRQFVGLTTLGTFMPVLIGLAFRETALVNGILLFSLLIALGLGLRFVLERLQLLLVPRLATVLVFVIICMSIFTTLFSSYDQSIGLSVSLFPMVILTMTIERMSIIWEEYSPFDAIKQGAGSLLVASLAYVVMTNGHVEFIMFHFPELLLVVMAICLLMGRYTGLRLSELWRFRNLLLERKN